MAVSLTKKNQIKLENTNMSILDEIKSVASELGFTLFNNCRPQYRKGAKVQIISRFTCAGDSGLSDNIELFGKRVRVKKENDHKFDVEVTVTLDEKINTHVALHEHYDDGYLHEKLAKALTNIHRYMDFTEVHGSGSELITVSKTI